MKHLFFFCIVLLGIICLILFTGCGRSSDSQFPFVVPWDDDSATVTDMSPLLHMPAGKYGHVFVDSDGHLSLPDGRIRFWGVSMVFGACFPDKKDAEKIARHLAKSGVNLVRFHHFDMYTAPAGIWKSVKPDREINHKQLDKLDYFIYQLKSHGIYSSLSLLVSRPFHPGKEIDKSIEKISFPFNKRLTFTARKSLLFFDEAVNKVKKDFFVKILTHKNPYIGSDYAHEPAIAWIEPLNECSTFLAYHEGFFSGYPSYYKDTLNGKWIEWLLNKYGSKKNIIGSWEPKSFDNTKKIMTHKDFLENPGELIPRALRDSITCSISKNSGINQQDALKMSIDIAGMVSPAGIPFSDTLGIMDSASDLFPGISADDTRMNPRLWWRTIILMEKRIEGLKARTPYRFQFYFKSDINAMLTAGVIMNHHRINFQRIKTDENWSHYVSDTINPEDSSCITIQLGAILSQNTEFMLSHLILEEALDTEDPEAMLFEDVNKKSFELLGDSVVSINGIYDWYTFCGELESSYWEKETDFLKNSIGMQCLVASTMAGITSPFITRMADIVSDVDYWEHPRFHGEKAWDDNDWFVFNDSIFNYPYATKLSEGAINRVKGKPFIFSEYNHPHPNTFEAEALFFLSAYASLQDWDGVIVYSYSHTNNNWGSESIRNNFDIVQHPVKMISMIPAALNFLRFDTKPAERRITIPISKTEELDILSFRSLTWKMVDPELRGFDSSYALIHQTEVDPFLESSGPEGSFPRDFAGINNVYTADTGELLWNAAETGRGFMKLDTKKTKVFAGFAGKSIRFSGGDIDVLHTLQDGYCALSLSSLSGSSIEEPGTFLLTALGTVRNTDSKWFIYPDKRVKFPPPRGKEVTMRNKWGKFPTIVEGIQAKITIYNSTKNPEVYSLDGRGERRGKIDVTAGTGSFSFEISSENKTLWYEIEMK
ncbi:MAG: hypothetical protein JXJ04_21270 [Spirochaetales bacterium]|nr:hypothetical protein [Spirochaetales bacterium]